MTTGTPQPMDPHQPGGRPGGARARRGPSLLPLLLVGWALLEVWLLILLGDAAGGLTVFLVLLGGLLVGTLVIKRAGRRAWQRLAESVQQQQAAARGGPAPEPVRTGGGNGLAMLGGLLLIIPGLLCKVAGLLCVLPPTAALLRATTRRVLAGSGGPLGTAYTEARQAHDTMRAHRPDGRIVPGEVIEHPADTDDPYPPEPGEPEGPTGRPGPR